MNVRITSIHEGERMILNIAGRLQSADLAELNKEITSDVASLMLDLSELLSADRAGIELLRELVAMGAELRGVSRYMQMLLNDQ